MREDSPRLERKGRPPWGASTPGPRGQALFFRRRADERFQFAVRVHFANDIAPANELTVDIHLGDGRPVGVVLDPLTDGRIFEYVHALIRNIVRIQDLHGCRREATHGEARRAFHENEDLALFHLLINLRQDSIVRHYRLLLLVYRVFWVWMLTKPEVCSSTWPSSSGVKVVNASA